MWRERRVLVGTWRELTKLGWPNFGAMQLDTLEFGHKVGIMVIN